jgi:hypothetical protein
MTFHRLAPSLLLLALSACSFAGKPAEPPKVTGVTSGQLEQRARVGARRDGQLFLAEITEERGGQYVVAFADGGTATVGRDDVLPVAKPGTLATGARILAPKGAGEVRLFQGEVVAVEGADVVVVFDGAPDRVKVGADRVAVTVADFCDAGAGCVGSNARQKKATGGGAPAAGAEPSLEDLEAMDRGAYAEWERSRLKIGASVLAFKDYDTNLWVKATVTAREGDSFDVNDGKDTFRPYMRFLHPFGPKRLKPNDVVIARCPGGAYLRMFVKELAGDDVTVWKDDLECSVKRADLAFTDKN